MEARVCWPFDIVGVYERSFVFVKHDRAGASVAAVWHDSAISRIDLAGT
jgi:hypothetical protein